MVSIIVDANEVFAAFITEGIVHELLFKISPRPEYTARLSEGLKLAPHSKDVEYFALALKLDFPIWSNEKAFKKQSVVKVCSTSDLFSFLPKTRPAPPTNR